MNTHIHTSNMKCNKRSKDSLPRSAPMRRRAPANSLFVSLPTGTVLAGILKGVTHVNTHIFLSLSVSLPHTHNTSVSMESQRARTPIFREPSRARLLDNHPDPDPNPSTCTDKHTCSHRHPLRQTSVSHAHYTHKIHTL